MAESRCHANRKLKPPFEPPRPLVACIFLDLNTLKLFHDIFWTGPLGQLTQIKVKPQRKTPSPRDRLHALYSVYRLQKHVLCGLPNPGWLPGIDRMELQNPQVKQWIQAAA
ncbi:predicted protein [Coccidioides posadasii str. Silveira]|uniref:Predicted protein n=1 Tax=Coccidioides posadasii (strain RMSCC 757 / Silveira) TaxID=443226 RepID=E9D8D5_COCPS|nr:predicted protein [Coccidioides posadasii str. Silveira]